MVSAMSKQPSVQVNVTNIDPQVMRRLRLAARGVGAVTDAAVIRWALAVFDAHLRRSERETATRL